MFCTRVVVVLSVLAFRLTFAGLSLTESEIDSVREKVKSIVGVPKVVEFIREGKVEGQIYTATDECLLRYHGGNSLLVHFETRSSELSNLLQSTHYDKDRISLEWVKYFKQPGGPGMKVKYNGTVSVFHNVERAHRYLAQIMPFAHLSDQVSTKLRSYWPITSGDDHEKCNEVFLLLANNPPGEYSSGVGWFKEFHTTASRKALSLMPQKLRQQGHVWSDDRFEEWGFE